MRSTKILNLIAGSLIFSSSLVAASPYTAVVRCSVGDKHANPMLCLMESEIKITKHKRATVYNLINLANVGEWYKDALVIELPEKFSIEMNNSTEIFILSVKIIDKEGYIITEDQAGVNGVISIKH